MPQGLLNCVSHLRGPARLGEPQEVMLLKELDAHRIERIAGEENDALGHVGRFGLQQMIKLLSVEFRQAQVAQDEVIVTFAHLAQRTSPIVCRLHGIPITAEERC